MRILAIRGRNLASLAGDFAVEFNEAPLRHTGLFAITGPTGSGKSTLLDTLCLALFDRTPRFENSHQFRLVTHSEENALMSGDVRQILRRGAFEGMAQVDFTGCDGKSYQATWTVRRARNKASGKFQPQSMSLKDLATEQELGDTRRKETLNLIKEKLGLDFKQFCRSVLLAQGEFAAFIKAKPNQRAELLERMTGTEIYSKISRIAFQKTREVCNELKDHEDRIKRLEVLGGEERKKLETEHQDRIQTCNNLLANAEKVKAQLSWRNTWLQLQGELDKATAALSAADANLKASQEQRHFLDRVECAQPLRQHLNAVDHSRKITGEQHNHFQETEKDMAAAQTRNLELAPILDTARTAMAQIMEAREKQRPELEKARHLDARLTSVGERLTSAITAREEAQLKYKEAEQEYLQQLDAKTELEKELTSLTIWFQDHADHHLLVTDWNIWQTELTRFSVSSGHVQKLLETAAQEEQNLAKKEKRLFQLGQERQTAETNLTLAETHAAETRKAAASFSIPQLREERERLNQQLRLLEQCKDSQVRWNERQESFHNNEKELRRLRSELAEMKEEAAQTGDALPQMTARLEEAERAFKLAETAAGFQAQRSTLLTTDQPCPLCGATEHPYAHNEPPPAFLEEQLTRVRQLRSEHHALIKKDSGLNTSISVKSKQLKRLELEHAEENKKVQHAAETRNGILTQLTALTSQDPPQTLFQIELQLNQLKETITQVGKEQEKAEKAAESVGKAEEKARQLAALRDKCKDEYQALAIEATEVGKNLKHTKEELTQKRNERDEARTKIHSICSPGDKETLEHHPETFQQICQERVDQWKKRQEWETEKKNKLHSLEKAISAAGERRLERKENLIPLTETCGQLEAEHGELKTKRAELLGGKTVDQATQALEDATDKATKQVDTARDAIEKINRELASLQARHKQQQTGLKDARDRLTGEEEALGRELQKLELEEPQARDLLKYDQPWIQEQRATFQKMEADVKHWTSLHAERKEKLTNHQSQGDLELDWEELASRELLLKEQLEAEQEARDRVKTGIMLDDDRRNQKKQEEMGMEDKIHQTQLWQALNELIGSAEGDKFRKFAQSLTLEILIDSTNDHLLDLEPRYQLQRAAGSDLELQVIDRDMADEPRGLNSLSGGESFLVSLALALGLSSLSVNRTQIDSLFIDEGFGSLDANTLDSALAVLDMLQASGRSVGIISHVPTVAERVGVRLCLIPTANGGSRLELQDC